MRLRRRLILVAYNAVAAVFVPKISNRANIESQEFETYTETDFVSQVQSPHHGCNKVNIEYHLKFSNTVRS
jgi:hypothetical protein